MGLTDKLAHNIARQYNLDYQEVRNVCTSQFNLAKKAMKNKDDIYFRYIGKFEYSKQMEKQIEKMNKNE